MSATITVGGIAMAALGSAGFIAASPLLAVGGSVIAVGALIGMAGSSIAGLGESIGEMAQIVNKERQISRELSNRYRALCQTAELASCNEQAHLDRITQSFTDATVINNARARDIISGAKNPMEAAFTLIDIQATYSMLESNYASLAHACEELNLDCSQIEKEYRNLLDKANSLSVDKLESTVNRINQLIEEKMNSYHDIIEKAIREKKFESNFFQVVQEKPQLFEAMFSHEISEFLNNPPQNDEELLELIGEKRLNEIRLKLYEISMVLKDAQGFEEYSDQIIRLIGSSEKLAQRKNMPLVDFENEINLKLKSLKLITKKLEDIDSYNRQKHFLETLNMLNYYRQLLYLDPVERVFTGENDEIFVLEKELEETKSKYESEALAKHVSAQLKLRYTKLNYRHIPADKTVKTSKTTLYKSYFVTPDQKNILCITVNENGQVFERVAGVKIQGLADDKRDILNAQHKFCQDSRRVLSDTFTKDVKVTLDDPDLKYALAEDFSGIIPQNEINRIRDARQARQAQAQIERTIN